MQITVQTQIAAPLTTVWQAYTSPAAIVQWNAASDDWHTTDATVDLRVGGQFCSKMAAKDGSFSFDFAGTYTAVEPGRLLAYQFGDRHARVEFSEDAGIVLVRVLFDPEDTHPLDAQQQGWQAILDNFARYVARQTAEAMRDI